MMKTKMKLGKIELAIAFLAVFSFAFLLATTDTAKEAVKSKVEGLSSEGTIIKEALEKEASLEKASDKEFLGVLFLGQSNMRTTRTDSKELPSELKKVPDNVYYYNFEKKYSGRSVKEYAELPVYGPEVMILSDLSKKYPNRKIVGIKYAVGGTSLYAWSPHWDEKKATITNDQHHGSLYKKANDYVKKVTKTKKMQWIGFFWMQGEDDSYFKPAADDYKNNLKDLITSLKQDMDAPNAKFYLGRVNPPKEKYKYVGTVRNAQSKSVKEGLANGIINLDDLTKSDGIHYDNPSVLKMGERFSKLVK